MTIVTNELTNQQILRGFGRWTQSVPFPVSASRKEIVIKITRKEIVIKIINVHIKSDLLSKVYLLTSAMVFLKA